MPFLLFLIIIFCVFFFTAAIVYIMDFPYVTLLPGDIIFLEGHELEKYFRCMITEKCYNFHKTEYCCYIIETNEKMKFYSFNFWRGNLSKKDPIFFAYEPPEYTKSCYSFLVKKL